MGQKSKCMARMAGKLDFQKAEWPEGRSAGGPNGQMS